MTFPPPFLNDLISCSIDRDTEWKPSRSWDVEDGAQWEDEWGNVWRRFSNTTRGEVIEGVLKDWSDLDNYVLPRFDLPSRYEKAKNIFLENPDRFRVGHLPGFPFAIMRYMRRMEVFLADLLLYPDEVMELQQRVVELLNRCIDLWSSTEADAVMFAEDWGTQERLLVSPDLWRRIFLPGFEAIVDHANSMGIQVWMHSCGYIKDIIPELRDIGISLLQLDQPELSGIDWLRETIGGRVAIWSPVDIQKRLPTGDKEQIRAAARELVEKLGSFGGGYIAGFYGDPKSLGIDPQWQIWACEAFEELAASSCEL